MHDLDRARQIHLEIKFKGIEHNAETREWAREKLEKSRSSIHKKTDQQKAQDLR